MHYVTRVLFVARWSAVGILLGLWAGTGVMAAPADDLPGLQAGRMSVSPVIDGRVDEEAWHEAARSEVDRILYETRAPEVKTHFWLGYDDSFLYIAARCFETDDRDVLAIPGETHPGSINAQDSLELFLMPDEDTYYHFFLAAGGATRSQRRQRGMVDRGWSIDYRAAAQVVDKGWEAEWAIPLALLRSADRSGTLGFNLCRVRHSDPRQLLTWAPLGRTGRRGFHDPDHFGFILEPRELLAPLRAAPHLVAAAIESPYRRSAEGGFVYDLSVHFDHTGEPGRVELEILHPVSDEAIPYRRQCLGIVEVPPGHSRHDLTVAWEEPFDRPPTLRSIYHGALAGKVQPRDSLLLTPGARRLSPEELEDYGARAVTAGNPIGGGAGYDAIHTGGDHTVRNAAALIALLERLHEEPGTTPGVIFVPGDAVLDFSEAFDPARIRPPTPLLQIPEGWTLAGDRGAGGSAGGVLRFDFTESQQEVIAAGKEPNPFTGRVLIGLEQGARLTGLRLRGPTPPVLEAYYPGVGGIAAVSTLGPGSQVDNCEISHFHYAGVAVRHGATRVRHNSFADIHCYPVISGGESGHVLVEGNRIHWSWHAIAGSGAPGTGYEAAHNEFIHVGRGGSGFALDMHAWRRMMRGHGAAYPYLSIAGERIVIRHNTFKDDHESIRAYRAARGLPAEGALPTHDVTIRGVPQEGAVIFRNRFVNPNPAQACELTDNIGGPPGAWDHANYWVYDNVYGPDHVLGRLPYETLPRIRFIQPGMDVPRVDNRWSTRHVNLLGPDARVPVSIEVKAMPPLTLRHVMITAGNLETGARELYRGNRAPWPGEIRLDAAAWGPGCYVLTVDAMDERGVTGRLSTSFTVTEDIRKNPAP